MGNLLYSNVITALCSAQSSAFQYLTIRRYGLAEHTIQKLESLLLLSL